MVSGNAGCVPSNFLNEFYRLMISGGSKGWQGGHAWGHAPCENSGPPVAR